MKIESVAGGLLFLYVLFLCVGSSFVLFVILKKDLFHLIINGLFMFTALIVLDSADFSGRSIRWGPPVVATLVFASVTFFTEKSLSAYAFIVIVAGALLLASDALPFPISRIARAIGAVGAGIGILEITTISAYFGFPIPPLLVPNFLLYGALIASATGYVVEVRFPRLSYSILLGMIAIMGIAAILVGGTLLQELPPLTTLSQELRSLTTFELFLSAVALVGYYLATVILTVLGVLALIYLAKALLAKETPPGEQPRRAEEVEIEPYTPDRTEAR